MCGIWGFISKNVKNNVDKIRLYKAFMNIKHRGPDKSIFTEINTFIDLFLGFHRLAIMDVSSKGDQPFVYEDEMNNVTTYCICNGEIYNYKELIKKYGIVTKSSSDCEVIPIIYRKYGIEQLLEDIKCNEFAFVIIKVHRNENRIEVSLGRDPIGIRPIFYANTDEVFAFSSEMKGLINIVNPKDIMAFVPGTYMTVCINMKDNQINMNHKITRYYNNDYKICKTVKDPFDENYLDGVRSNIRRLLEKSVITRLQSDREIGALLSGGLDSSIVVGIAARYLAKHGKKLRTFSIGIDGAGTDKNYALAVAKHCGTDHMHVDMTRQEFLDAIPHVIWATETLDITTIRASTGQYLISKWIREHTDIKVVLNGDTADETFGSYAYFSQFPTLHAFHWECKRLLDEIYLYDVLRCDRGISSNGLEGRVPYANCDFVDYYMSLPPIIRTSHPMTKGAKPIEKWLIRSAFEKSNYINKETLFRIKEGFSDGCSSDGDGSDDGKIMSWYLIIQKMANTLYTDDEFTKLRNEYVHMKPTSKECLYYRKIFDKMFGDAGHITPHMWLPKWCGDNITEPSARILKCYNN